MQLTDDVWFGRSAAAAQHNLASVLRAVENRVPVVIASNTGPSQLIDAHGRVVRRASAMFTAETVVGNVSPGRSLHAGFSGLFIVLMAVIAVAGFARRHVGGRAWQRVLLIARRCK